MITATVKLDSSEHFAGGYMCFLVIVILLIAKTCFNSFLVDIIILVDITNFLSLNVLVKELCKLWKLK